MVTILEFSGSLRTTAALRPSVSSLRLVPPSRPSVSSLRLVPPSRPSVSSNDGPTDNFYAGKYDHAPRRGAGVLFTEANICRFVHHLGIGSLINPALDLPIRTWDGYPDFDTLLRIPTVSHAYPNATGIHIISTPLYACYVPQKTMAVLPWHLNNKGRCSGGSSQGSDRGRKSSLRRRRLELRDTG